MDEQKARLIENNMVSFANCCLLSKAEGYLEAIEKANALEAMLTMISEHPHSRFDTAVKEALAKWKEVK